MTKVKRFERRMFRVSRGVLVLMVALRMIRSFRVAALIGDHKSIIYRHATAKVGRCGSRNVHGTAEVGGRQSAGLWQSQADVDAGTVLSGHGRADRRAGASRHDEHRAEEDPLSTGISQADGAVPMVQT